MSVDPCPVCGCQRYDGTCYNHECSETDHRPRRVTSDVPPRGGYAVPLPEPIADLAAWVASESALDGDS